MTKYKKMVYLIGGVVSFGNAFELVVGYILPPQNPFIVTMIDLFIRNFLSILSVFPKGLPLLIALSRNDQLLSLIALWQIIVLLCGIGILAFKNFARIIFVVICVMAIVLSLFVRLFFLLFEAVPSAPLVFGLMNEFGWILPLVYVFILTRPKVKELFKQPVPRTRLN